MLAFDATPIPVAPAALYPFTTQGFHKNAQSQILFTESGITIEVSLL